MSLSQRGVLRQIGVALAPGGRHPLNAKAAMGGRNVASTGDEEFYRYYRSRAWRDLCGGLSPGAFTPYIPSGQRHGVRPA